MFPKGRGLSRLVLLSLQSTFGLYFYPAAKGDGPCYFGEDDALTVSLTRFCGLSRLASLPLQEAFGLLFISRGTRGRPCATLVRMARSPFRLRGGILVSWRIPCARLGSLSVSRSPWDIYNIPHRVIECKLFLFVKMTE